MWTGSWLFRREKDAPGRSVGQRLETIANNRRDRRHTGGVDTLNRHGPAQLRVVMTTRRRFLGRYAVTACKSDGAMMFQLVLVVHGVCRFPSGLG